MKVGNVKIGTDHVYVIAEAGVNHNGDIELAKKLIDAAKNASADAIKFQTFTTDEIVTDKATQAAYQSENTGIVESQASMLRRLELSHEAFAALKKYAAERNIEFLSTPFSFIDADFLHSIDLSAYKVSSGDLTNHPFLKHLAQFKKPVLISTGMSTLEETQDAYATLKNADAEVIVMQCTSEYPTPQDHANLRVIETFKKTFDTPIGYSDHTTEIDTCVYAASLGASVVEKHFTLDRNLPGPDQKASLEPHELTQMILEIREGKMAARDVPEHILGSGEKEPTKDEVVTAKLVRKGIAARIDIGSGETLSESNVFIARPEGLIPPKDWARVLGRRAKRDIPKGTPLAWDMIA